MKRNFLVIVLISIAVFFVAWGPVGHRAVGLIAMRHLTPKAAAAVKSLLTGETLEDVANWADEVRNDAAYKQTGPWHYINLPLGLSRKDFDNAVEHMDKENVYEALQQQEQILSNKNASRDERINALKFIVHFTGDLHQPMHVSREEDKGGNTIQVNYDGKGTNLHALWDSRLIEHSGLSEDQLVAKIDHASTAEINQWQKAPLLDWVWESYQASSVLYREIEQQKNRTINDSYYTAHWPIIEDRLEKAGIRLAGILNSIFEKTSVPSAPAAAAPAKPVASGSATGIKKIALADVAAHVNEQAAVTGQVYTSKDMGSMTLVNLGAPYPNQLLTVVLRGAAKKAFTDLDGKKITVKGEIVLYKEKPEIVVTDAGQITVE